MLSIVLVIVAFVIILIGAELFTNAIEWLGAHLHLGTGAVGSVLAAVGTALPESVIPIIAFISGGTASHEIGTGAVLGAPFMLSTLTMVVTGVAALAYLHRRETPWIHIQYEIVSRDLLFFFMVYIGAIASSFLNVPALRYTVAGALILLYGVYVWLTVKRSSASAENEDLAALRFAPKQQKPDPLRIIAQLVIALAAIVGGSNLLVNEIENVAAAIGISAFVISVIIIPIATELPEKFNSVLWIGQKKDTLAIGNITGAMVYQSSLLPAIGIFLSPWRLDASALASAVCALASSAFIAIMLILTKRMHAAALAGIGAIFYAGYLIYLFGFSLAG
ncbi:MAG: sodium:calcium antiporter [Firmicutes bacterium]|nr:sodium:calcium antiporter [Bacillota bacterium]